MTRSFHQGTIKSLADNEVFVFGSNLEGIHGAGAALDAYNLFGAELGVGVGPTGQCYAIPTKKGPYIRLPVSRILDHVGDFLVYAAAHPDRQFLLTAVGAGLAGFSDHVAAAWFRDASENVLFPPRWADYVR